MESGFDVWLFDYRASPDLKSARTRFTIDDVAREDWPTAIAKVFDGDRSPGCRCSRTASARCRSRWRCSGMPTRRCGSRCSRAVCSQVTVHPRSTWFNTFKVRIGLGPILEKMSPILEPEEERTLWNVIYDVILRIAPTPRGEGCGNAVCQWITAYFGLTHRHWQLDDDTHNDLGRLFGVSGVYPLRHIGNMVAAGKSLDHDGKDVYVKSDDIDDAGERREPADPDPVPRGPAQQDLLPGDVEANLRMAPGKQPGHRLRAEGAARVRAPRRDHRPGRSPRRLPLRRRAPRGDVAAALDQVREADRRQLSIAFARRVSPLQPSRFAIVLTSCARSAASARSCAVPRRSTSSAARASWVRSDHTGARSCACSSRARVEVPVGRVEVAGDRRQGAEPVVARAEHVRAGREHLARPREHQLVDRVRGLGVADELGDRRPDPDAHQPHLVVGQVLEALGRGPVELVGRFVDPTDVALRRARARRGTPGCPGCRAAAARGSARAHRGCPGRSGS